MKVETVLKHIKYIVISLIIAVMLRNALYTGGDRIYIYLAI